MQHGPGAGYLLIANHQACTKLLNGGRKPTLLDETGRACEHWLSVHSDAHNPCSSGPGRRFEALSEDLDLANPEERPRSLQVLKAAALSSFLSRGPLWVAQEARKQIM